MSLPCPVCHAITTVVKTKRIAEDHELSVKRYRKCPKCKVNWVSVETWIEKQRSSFLDPDEPEYMRGAFD